MEIKAYVNLFEKGNIKALASIIIDDMFRVNNIKILESEKGLYVAYPNYKSKDKDGVEEYKDICNPISKESRNLIKDKILSSYAQQQYHYINKDNKHKKSDDVEERFLDDNEPDLNREKEIKHTENLEEKIENAKQKSFSVTNNNKINLMNKEL
ncbi:MAG: SpoVG family protein [Oscillospiraceae bacterium]